MQQVGRELSAVDSLHLSTSFLCCPQAASPSGPGAAARVAGGERAQLSTAGLHWSVGLLAAAVYWFYMQVAQVQRGVVARVPAAAAVPASTSGPALGPC